MSGTSPHVPMKTNIVRSVPECFIPIVLSYNMKRKKYHLKIEGQFDFLCGLTKGTYAIYSHEHVVWISYMTHPPIPDDTLYCKTCIKALKAGL